MLSENLRQNAVATAVDAFDADAITAGKLDRGELTLEIAGGKIVSICGFLKYDQKFIRLSSVTAVDWYPAEPRFEVVYHLHSIELKQRVRLKCRLSGIDPAIESITSVWRGANWYEREVFDLFGINFVGHPDLRRIMMPDDWDGHPLRKDYPVTGTRI
ncbi:MAG TPA: NADH-quinone oxidoreductase subunit C [Bryobacteraceae bacterium]|jgi:NADH-quinone oxidoreductase subunit C|nr:NADH-quinone oxidoreductase subunit C [Bryobacteraceae bacterium]